MNKEEIKGLLMSNDRAVERAMVTLYHRQTVSEQHTSSTTESNGRGFNAFHAERGTYYAKWVISGRRLTGHHLSSARKMACYYARQLAELSVTPASPRPKTYKVYSEEELCVAITQWDRFQQFPGVTQGL
jgi:hypothetical protein